MAGEYEERKKESSVGERNRIRYRRHCDFNFIRSILITNGTLG